MFNHEIYHFDKNNNIVECQNPNECSVVPSTLHQYHGYLNDINKHYCCQEYFLEDGKGYKTSPDFNEININVDFFETAETVLEHLTITARKVCSYDENLISYQAWLQDDNGIPMAFVKYMVNKNRRVVELCDIEVRPEYRGHNIGRHLINAIGVKYNLNVIHEGGYTNDGLKYISGMFNHNKNEIAELNSNKYKDMSFVLDWDNMWPKYGI